LYLFDYNTIYIYIYIEREREKLMKMKGHQRSGNVSNFGLTTIKKKHTNIYHNLMHVQIDEFLVFLFLLRAELIIKSIYTSFDYYFIYIYYITTTTLLF